MRQPKVIKTTLGDLIVAVGGRSVRTVDDLQTAFQRAGAGATVTLTVERDGKRRDVKLPLIELE